jgi:Arm DNA-binding domain
LQAFLAITPLHSVSTDLTSLGTSLEPLKNRAMPKQIQPLTAKGLDAVRPRDGEVIELGDGLLPGLRVRVSGGGRFWSLNIRNANGERRRFDVGAHLTLAEARRCAEALKKTIKQGGDPTRDRRDARQRAEDAKAGIGTFRSVIDVYFERGDGAAHFADGEQRFHAMVSSYFARW